MKKTTINYHDLMEYGFLERTARSIIRQGKSQMVKSGYSVYDNKRVGTVPVDVIEEIVGFPLFPLDKER